MPPPRVPARVGDEVERGVGQEIHVEERLVQVPRERVRVHEVDDAEIAEAKDEPAAVDRGPELLRVRLLFDGRAAEVNRLLEVRPRPINLGGLGALLLELEVLDRPAQASQLR